MPRLPAVLTSPYLLLLLTITFWAGNSTVGRWVAGEVPPITLSFWRWAIALIVVSPFAGRALVRDLPVLRRHWKATLALSALSVAAFNTLLYIGLQYTTVVNASLVAGVMPVLIVVLSWLVFRTRITGMEAAGIAVSLGGVVVLVARGEAAVLAQLSFNPGDLVVLAAVVSWAAYSALLRLRPPGVSGPGFLLATIILGLAMIAPFYGWEVASGARANLTPANLAAIAYTGIFPSALAYLFWNRGVAALGANRAGQFVYLSPALGAAFGVVFLGERMAPYHLAGIALVFAGIWLARKRRV